MESVGGRLRADPGVGGRNRFKAGPVPDHLERRQHLDRRRLAAFNRLPQVVQRDGAASGRQHLVRRGAGRHPRAAAHGVCGRPLAVPHLLDECVQRRERRVGTRRLEPLPQRVGVVGQRAGRRLFQRFRRRHRAEADMANHRRSDGQAGIVAELRPDRFNGRPLNTTERVERRQPGAVRLRSVHGDRGQAIQHVRAPRRVEQLPQERGGGGPHRPVVIVEAPERRVRGSRIPDRLERAESACPSSRLAARGKQLQQSRHRPRADHREPGHGRLAGDIRPRLEVRQERGDLTSGRARDRHVVTPRRVPSGGASRTPRQCRC
jgi:hypothetical protein